MYVQKAKPSAIQRYLRLEDQALMPVVYVDSNVRSSLHASTHHAASPCGCWDATTVMQHRDEGIFGSEGGKAKFHTISHSPRTEPTRKRRLAYITHLGRSMAMICTIVHLPRRAEA